MALSITFGGTDFTSRIDFKSVKATLSTESSGNNLAFQMRVYDLDPMPTLGSEVIFKDGTNKEFGGALVRRSISEQGPRYIQMTATCQGYSWLLDRRFLNKLYATKSASNGGQTGGSAGMVEEILEDLKNAADDNDFFYNAFVTNLSASNIDVGPVIRQQIFNHTKPTQAFDTIASSTGMIWWVDQNKTINFKDLSANGATHLPLDSFGFNILDIGSNTTDYYDLEYEDSILDVGSKAILPDSIFPSTAFTVDKFKFTTDGNGSQKRQFSFERKPFSDLHISQIRRIRGETTVVCTQALDDVVVDQDVDDLPETSPPTAYIYVGRRGQKDSYVRFMNTSLQHGDVVEVTYQYEIGDDHEGIQIETAEELALATGGDGVHEFVFAQASEVAAASPNDLDEIADMLLERKGTIPYPVEFKSRTKGWEAGQVFRMVWSLIDFDATMYVLTVSKSVLTPSDSNSLSDNIIEYTITASNIPRGLRF